MPSTVRGPASGHQRGFSSITLFCCHLPCCSMRDRGCMWQPGVWGSPQSDPGRVCAGSSELRLSAGVGRLTTDTCSEQGQRTGRGPRWQEVSHRAALPLTIRDHDSADHGSKHNREGERLETQRWHVAPGGKGPVLLLRERRNKEKVL